MYILIDSFVNGYMEILMISEDYNKIRNYLKNYKKRLTHIYTIIECEIDKELEGGNTIVRLICHSNGSISTSIDENYKY